MRYRVPLALLVTTIAIAVTPPLSNPLLSTLRAIADEIRSYGIDGTDGRNGRPGSDGAAGSSRTIRATGATQAVYTGGSDGQDGEAGETGNRPACHSQPSEVEYDLQAPDGGDGGDGGAGGNGGNGGDVTIYYTNLADLRLITVNSHGGRGGRG